MEIKNITNLQSKYNFEAPMFAAQDKSSGYIFSGIDFNTIDLFDFLAPKPDDIYLVRVSGDSMIDENIFDGDILVVSKSEMPRSGKIIIASIDGELTVKKYIIHDNKTFLYPANPKYLPIEVSLYDDFRVQGIVKHIIRDM